MSAPRAILGLVVLALAAWFLVAVFKPTGRPLAAPTAFTSSEQCKECHPTEYAEWKGSQHSLAWTNPAVRALSNDFANQDCIDCHAPKPVFVTGIGERVLPRVERRTEGVDCIACHQLPGDGGMAGTLTDATAACRPVETLDLIKPEFCAGCHNQHKTVDQWRESDWPAKGMDCRACHMVPRVGSDAKGHDHGFPGGNVLAMVQKAVELGGERDGQGWKVVVKNVYAGHTFPTDERSRAADVFWRPVERDGAPIGPWRHLHRMRDPYRTEPDLPSTLLFPGERRELALADPEASGAVEVGLFYKRSPYWKDPEHPDPEQEAELVHRITLRP